MPARLVENTPHDTTEARLELLMIGDSAIGAVMTTLAGWGNTIIMRRTDPGCNLGQWCFHTHAPGEYGADGYGDTPVKALHALLVAIADGKPWMKWDYGMSER